MANAIPSNPFSCLPTNPHVRDTIRQRQPPLLFPTENNTTTTATPTGLHRISPTGSCSKGPVLSARANTTSHPHTATFLLLLLLVLLLRQVCHEDKNDLFTGSLAVQIKAHTSSFAKG